VANVETAGAPITSDGIATTDEAGTVLGTEVAGIITTVYDGIVTTSVTLAGTSVAGIKTGLAGIVVELGI
jgi:hypothetical protein